MDEVREAMHMSVNFEAPPKAAKNQ
jgi:hypothetical protein